MALQATGQPIAGGQPDWRGANNGHDAANRPAFACFFSSLLDKAKQKVPHRLYAVCLMANHLHLLLRPDDASQLPKLMHWIGWYSAMALNRLSGRCGHFWEARYYATAIAPKDHRQVLNTLRYIHANPKAAGIRKGFLRPLFQLWALRKVGM